MEIVLKGQHLIYLLGRITGFAGHTKLGITRETPVLYDRERLTFRRFDECRPFEKKIQPFLLEVIIKKKKVF